MKNLISSAIVEKYLLKSLATLIGSLEVAVLLMIALEDMWFRPFSEIMFLYPSKYLSGF